MNTTNCSDSEFKMDYLQQVESIKNSIRVIDNWPTPGVKFRDITTLLQNPKIFKSVVNILASRYQGTKVDAIAGLDARGFIFGPVVAYELGIAFVPIRKPGKLPFKTYTEDYELEYGSGALQIHSDAVAPNDKIVIIDDLIATGGTMLAACNLITKCMATVVECAVINDLLYLGGSKLIRESGFLVYSIVEYE